MSAFIVEDEIINRIVSWCNVKAMASLHDFNVRPLTELGYRLDTELGCKRLAEEMFTLNCDSIEQRYGKGQAETFRPLDFKFRFTGFSSNIYQVLKSLRCFLYQCCEGNIPKQNALYKALEKLSDNICYTIATSNPQYENAKW